jgi:3-hydroxyacyl-CoA dehydrogenase
MNERIGIVGTGLIGRTWAIVFARAACHVAIFFDMVERSRWRDNQLMALVHHKRRQAS